MYVFISYSWHDKPFVRELADSLASYGIDIFLDEREIKVGDNIPAKIYGAIERATHVIYVLSKNSIQSRWVAEELSIAKMRQLNEQGCQILPILIDDVIPPPAIAHIKYADFRTRKISQSYLESLRELLSALGIKVYPVSSSEIRFFQQHLTDLVKIKKTVDTIAESCFQFERLQHAPLNKPEVWSIEGWFTEAAGKTWNFESFQEASKVLENELQLIGPIGEKTNQMIKLCKAVENNGKILLHLGSIPRDQRYEKYWKGEEPARELSALIYSIILEIQSLIVSPKEGT